MKNNYSNKFIGVVIGLTY